MNLTAIAGFYKDDYAHQVCGVMIMGYTYASEGTSANVRIIQYNQMVKKKLVFIKGRIPCF